MTCMRAAQLPPRRTTRRFPGPGRTLVPCVRVTSVLPTWRTANMEGALTSDQSFLLKGSAAFFLPPFFPLLRSDGGHRGAAGVNEVQAVDHTRHA